MWTPPRRSDLARPNPDPAATPIRPSPPPAERPRARSPCPRVRAPGRRARELSARPARSPHPSPTESSGPRGSTDHPPEHPPLPIPNRPPEPGPGKTPPGPEPRPAPSPVDLRRRSRGSCDVPTVDARPPLSCLGALAVQLRRELRPVRPDRPSAAPADVLPERGGTRPRWRRARALKAIRRRDSRSSRAELEGRAQSATRAGGNAGTQDVGRRGAAGRTSHRSH